MNFMEITVRGQVIKFYPKGNVFGYYFEMPNNHGFYTNDLFKVWGKPNKSNCVEVAKSYIESMPSRITTFDSYKTLQQ